MKEIFTLKHERKKNGKYRKEEACEIQQKCLTHVITVQAEKGRENSVQVIPKELMVENYQK